MNQELKEQIELIKSIADRSRSEYASTREWTTTEQSGCRTLRVPVFLLNRIDELADLAKGDCVITDKPVVRTQEVPNLAAEYLIAIGQVMKELGKGSTSEVIDNFEPEIAGYMRRAGIDDTVAEDVAERTGWCQMRGCNLKF